MLEAITYDDMMQDIKERRKDRCSSVVGILLTRPDLESKNPTLKKLDYFHHRSSNQADFYLPGYGAYWHNCYPDKVPVFKIDDVKWFFSKKLFAEFINEFEKHIQWRFEGKRELILFEPKDIQPNSSFLSYKFDDLFKQGKIESIDTFMEDIIYQLKKDTPLNEYKILQNIDFKSENIIKKQNTTKITYNFDIHGEIKNSQFQIGSNNSKQLGTFIDTFEYEKVLTVLEEIKREYDSESFKKSFGSEDLLKIKKLVDDSIKMSKQKDDPAKIKASLVLLRDIATKATGSLVATGILSLISELSIY